MDVYILSLDGTPTRAFDSLETAVRYLDRLYGSQTDYRRNDFDSDFLPVYASWHAEWKSDLMYAHIYRLAVMCEYELNRLFPVRETA